MLKNRFIEQFRSVWERDLKEFEHYLYRLYGEHKIALKVYNYIKNQFPKCSPQNLNRSVAYARIFDDEPYNSAKISDALYQLNKIIEEFFLWQRVRKHSHKKEFILMSAYHERNLYRLAERHLLKIQGKAQREMKQSNNLEVLNLLLIYDLHYYSQRFENQRERSELMSKMMRLLDLFYFISKFRYSLEIMNQSKILAGNSPIKLLEESLSLAQEKEIQDNFYIQLYSSVLDLMESNEETSFLSVKRSLIKPLQLLSEREQFLILLYLINFAARKIREGKEEYYKYAFELYKIAIKNKLLLIDDYFDETPFFNILNIGCALNELSWTKKFVGEWSQYLADEIRSDALQLGNIRIYFAKGEYEKVVQIGSKIKSRNIYLTLQTKGLLLMAYCELDKDEDAENLCNSFYKLLLRKKLLNQDFKSAWLNLIKAVKQLLYSTHTKNEAEWDSYLESLGPIVQKKWLKEFIHK